MGEYLKVKEIAKIKQMTTRNVRNKILKLAETKNEFQLHKDNGEWMVHHLLLPLFQRERQRLNKYYSLTFDVPDGYRANEIGKVMEIIFNEEDFEHLDLGYTVEVKKANAKFHIHAYFHNKMGKNRVIESLRTYLGSISYQCDQIYDLERWKRYITKDGCPIIKLENYE